MDHVSLLTLADTRKAVPEIDGIAQQSNVVGTDFFYDEDTTVSKLILNNERGG